MIATTTTSARAAIELRGISGTRRSIAGSGAPARGRRSAGSLIRVRLRKASTLPSPTTSRRANPNWSISCRSWVAITTAVPSRCNSTNKPQKPARQTGIDVSRRLVSEQQFGAHDQRARDGGALLLAAGKDRRDGVHALAEADPAQEFDDLGAVAGFRPAEGAQRQGDVFVGRQMVEQAEILEDDADPPPERCQLVLGQRRGVLPEDVDGSSRRPQRQQHQPQERRLAGPRWPGQELKALRSDREIEVADDLFAQSIVQTDVFEAKQDGFTALATRTTRPRPRTIMRPRGTDAGLRQRATPVGGGSMVIGGWRKHEAPGPSGGGRLG